MGYYELSKKERQILAHKMEGDLLDDLNDCNITRTLQYSLNDDFYVRKNVSLILGRIYNGKKAFRAKIIRLVTALLRHGDEKVRQTSVYLMGEIGKKDADVMFDYLETAIRDPHHKVRNAVMSSLKVMGKKNPEPTLKFAKMFIHDQDPEVRKKVIHGIELRGRTHPEDVLPLLEEVQDEENLNVRKMIIHVLGQISYKKGCLEKVAAALKIWHNQEIVKDALPYIIEVHKKYPFSFKTPEEVEKYLKENFRGFNV